MVGASDHDDSYSRALKVRHIQVPGVVMTGYLSGDALREVFSRCRCLCAAFLL